MSNGPKGRISVQEHSQGMLKRAPRGGCKIHTKVRGDCRIIPKFEMESGREAVNISRTLLKGRNVDGNAIRTKA